MERRMPFQPMNLHLILLTPSYCLKCLPCFFNIMAWNLLNKTNTFTIISTRAYHTKASCPKTSLDTESIDRDPFQSCSQEKQFSECARSLVGTFQTFCVRMSLHVITQSQCLILKLYCTWSTAGRTWGVLFVPLPSNWSRLPSCCLCKVVVQLTLCILWIWDFEGRYLFSRFPSRFRIEAAAHVCKVSFPKAKEICLGTKESNRSAVWS